MYIINKEFVITVFMLINILFTPRQLSASCILKAKLREKNQVYLQKVTALWWLFTSSINKTDFILKSKAKGTERGLCSLDDTFVVTYKTQLSGCLDQSAQVSPALLVPALLSWRLLWNRKLLLCSSGQWWWCSLRETRNKHFHSSLRRWWWWWWWWWWSLRQTEVRVHIFSTDFQTNTDVDFTLHEDKWFNRGKKYILVWRMIQYFVVAPLKYGTIGAYLIIMSSLKE